jgi:hypothetical protein
MTLQEVLTALRNADAAGDVEAARRLAQIAESMQSQASQYDVQTQDIDRRLAELRAQKIKPETTFGGEVKEAFKGVVPGAIGLLETAGTGISALLPDETEKSAREKIKEIAGIAKKPFEAAEGYEDSVGRRLGEGLGSTLPFFAAGPLGLAGRVGAAGLGVSAGAGEARQRAEAEGATGEARATATLMGAPTGLLDLLAPNIGPLKNIITTALARGGIEGATEAAQQVAQNLIAKGLYKPEQAVVEGAGEEGAYGAGVGAIASVILDLTLGRKARGRATPGETEDTRTEGTPPAGPTAERPQGELFPSELETAQRELESVMGPTKPVAEEPAPAERTAAEAGQMSLFEGEAGPSELETTQPDLFGEIVPTREEATTEAVKEPTAERDTQTRDMIDELETAQIEELEAEEQSARLRKELETQKAEAKQERLKMESDIAELDGRIKAKEQKTTEDKRLGLLLPIIESEVKNIPKAFVQSLKREGFTNANLTDRERQLINRAYDVRLAEEPVPVEEPTIAQPKGQVEALEAQVPEKKARREPEQMSFPGMGKPKGAKAEPVVEEEVAVEEKPFATVLSADVLAQTGLPKQSGFYKQLIDMDMADPAQQPVVANIFAKVRTNPNVKPATKDAIENMAMQAFGGLAKQQELFPTKGAKPAKAKKEAPSEKSGTDAEPTGTRAGDREPSVSKPAAAERPAAPKRTEAPKPSGLGDTGQPVRDAGKRESVEPGALKKEAPKAEAKAEPKAEAKAEAKPTRTKETSQGKGLPLGDNAYQAAKEAGEVDHAIRTLAADAYLNTAEDYSVKKAQQMIAALEEGNVPELKFGTNNSNGPGTGGKFAKEFYASLDKDEQAKFRKELQDFLYSEIKSKNFMDAHNRQQAATREEAAAYDENSPLYKDIKGAATALHPMVVRMLKDNNLVGALRFIGQQQLGRASTVASQLADVLGGVNVEISDFSKPSGKYEKLLKQYPEAAGSSGAYITTKGGERTILLDSKTGMDVWSLLHEATHGAVNQTLNNTNSPLTKQLTQLFNDVKDSLDTAYGASDVKEFAAEAFSNPAFQQKLAAINPKGEKITAWQRFVHAVKNYLRNMIGLPTKGMGTALDSADHMIEAIVNGHPGTSNSLQTVSLLNKGAEFFTAMGKRAESLPGLNAERVGRIHEMFSGTLPNTVKNVIRQALPLNALVEVAQKYIPMAPKLDVMVGERAGAENRRNQAIEPVIDRVNAWAKANPALVDKLNNVIYRSTLDQVDPGKPRAEYAGKMDDSGNRKDEAWDAMQADWKALGASGQTTYKLMRDTYKKMYDDVRRVLDTRIDDALEDADTRKKVKAEIYQRLFASGHIEPYFPLTRSGKYWLSYTLGNEFFVEAFETNYQRDQAVKELRTEGATDVQRFANLNQVNYRKAPATSFVNNVLRTLEANKVNANVTEEVMRLFLNTLPETSFAQSFRKRKGTLGFQRDAVGALRMKAFNLSRQLSNMEYGAKLEKLRADMKEYVRSQGNPDEAVEMMNELDARIDYAISPQVPQWSKLATSFGFNMTLGFNVSSALVNLSQIPLVVMPYLGGKYGYSETSKALGRASRYFAGSGFKREVEMLVPTDKGEKTMKVRAFPSLDNYDFDAKDAPKHLKVLSEVAGARGQLNRSQVYDILDVDESQSVMTKINAASGFVFHHGERMNRQVAMIAAYELELQRLVGAGKDLTSASEKQMRQAADYAVYVTELTNGGTAAAAAPRLAQSAIGKVVFMYKRYGASMYYMLFKTAREALKSADPEVRKAAKRQIAGIYASSALMAGVQGIPMFGMAAMIYNLIFKDDDDDDFDTAARKYLGEGIYSGALNALTGLEISGRIGLSDLLFRDTNTRPSDSVMLSLMEVAGGPVIGVASRVERGLKLIGEGHIERGVEQILPSAIGNGLKAVRFATEGANTLRGDPIAGEIGPWNSFAQFFGFAPAEYTRQLEINSALKNIERTALEDRTKLLRNYYVAMRMGDTQEAANIAAEMLKYNRKHPGAAITADTVKKSMAQHMKTTKDMYHGITLSKSLRPQLLMNAAEYDDGIKLIEE